MRPVVPTDTPALVALACSSGLFKPGEADAIKGMLDEYHSANAGGGQMRVWDEGGTLVRVVYFAPRPFADRVWELMMIAVDAPRQRRGVGSRSLAGVEAAVRAADWAVKRRVVTNWNYNSFRVLLLAEVYRLTGDDKYLTSAKLKTRLGLLPGQLTDGPRQGRWADPHNARPAYHYILVRGLAALAAVLPKGDPDLPAVVESLRLALLARNPDFEKGVVNADSTVEALVRVKSLPPHVAEKLAGCKTDEALAALERYAADGFRAKKSPLGPGAWGQLLADHKERGR